MANFNHVEDSTYLLIDGDAIVYSVGFSPDLNREDVPPAHVYHQVKNMLNTIVDACPSSNTRIYLTSQDHSNYRYNVAETPGPGGQGYKAQRKKGNKPINYQMIRDYLVEHHRAQIIEGMEADDMLGIQATKPNRKAVIATFDKDLHMVPVDIYDIKKKLYMSYVAGNGLGGLELVQTKSKKKLMGRGVAWLYAQMILGDTVDNIPGIKGCGDVFAYNLLNECTNEEQYFDAVLGLYEEKVGDGHIYRFKEVATLLWMQTNTHRSITKRWRYMYGF